MYNGKISISVSGLIPVKMNALITFELFTKDRIVHFKPKFTLDNQMTFNLLQSKITSSGD